MHVLNAPCMSGTVAKGGPGNTAMYREKKKCCLPFQFYRDQAISSYSHTIHPRTVYLKDLLYFEPHP